MTVFPVISNPDACLCVQAFSILQATSQAEVSGRGITGPKEGLLGGGQTGRGPRFLAVHPEEGGFFLSETRSRGRRLPLD